MNLSILAATLCSKLKTGFSECIKVESYKYKKKKKWNQQTEVSACEKFIYIY